MNKAGVEQDNKKMHFAKCTMGIPTLGWISSNWMISTMSLARPIFYTIETMVVTGHEVGDARNMIAQHAIDTDSEYVFFIDDDVIVPRDALIRLYNHRVPIASGVYYSKMQPPKPLIFKWGELSGVEDWEHGDLLHVDACGMGCTLIETRLFKEMEPPWFKTVPDYLDGEMVNFTEDIYFCKRVREELGEDVLIDTNVQCRHEDFNNSFQYYFEPSVKQGAWCNFKTGESYYAPAGSKHPELIKDKTSPKEGEKE